jgi:hypothetical protein
MQATQTKTIDGIKFEVTQLPAMRALKVLHRLGKVVSPALSKAITGLGGGAGAQELDLSQLGPALESFFASCEVSDMEYFVHELLHPASADGVPLERTLDVKLQGKVWTLLKALVFAVEVNFGNFSEALPGAVAKLQAAKAGTPSGLKTT